MCELCHDGFCELKSLSEMTYKHNIQQENDKQLWSVSELPCCMLFTEIENVTDEVALIRRRCVCCMGERREAGMGVNRVIYN